MSGMQQTLPRSTWLLLIALTLGWGLNWPIMKIALAELPVWTFRGLSVAGGAVGLFLIAAASNARLLPQRNQWMQLTMSSLFNVTLWNVFIGYGLTLLPAGRSVILAYVMPLWVVLLSYFVLGESMTRRRVLGVALGMAGMGLLLLNEWAILKAAPVGALLVLSAAASWAIGTVLIKRYPTNLPTTSFTAWQLLLGGILIVVGALLFERHTWHAVSWRASAAVIYNMTIAFVFCYWAWFKIVSRAAAGVSALGTLMIPVVGVFSSMVLLGERPSWAEYAAMVLVFAAIATVVIPSRRLTG